MSAELRIPLAEGSFEFVVEDFSACTEQYWFDGSGQRVAKMGPSGTFIYVYDAAGQLIAEYASAATAAAPCSTCYLSTDHLGTPRLVTDENATVISRHDYFPFGEEVPANQVGRDAHFGSGNDTVSQKFTGQMRDIETGEDFFNARMFGSALGRFTSPNPDNAGADPMNPQSWNGYSYALGNPLLYTDPSGTFSITGFFGNLGDLLGSLGSGISNFFNPPCGADFCATGTGVSDVSTIIVGVPGGLTGGGGNGGGSGQSNFSVTHTEKVGSSAAPPKNGPTFTKTYLPGDLYQICAVGNTSFPAPYTFDITKVEAAGRAGGSNLVKMGAAVGHYGTFDFQRSRDSAGNTTFYSGFTPVSNFNVGVYEQSAGFSRFMASAIANTFALLKSSNFGDPAQAQYRNLGYDTAAKGQKPFCMNPD